MTSTLQQEAQPQAAATRRSRRCGSPSGCTRTATSPTCAPTRRRCRRRRSTRPRAQAAAALRRRVRARRAAPATTRKVKNAQEAHEAIRPSGDSFRTPGAGGRRAQRATSSRLYELIWKRTVASQMADARGRRVTVRLGRRPPPTAATPSSRRPARSSPSAASSPPTSRAATTTATPSATTTRAPAAAARRAATRSPRRELRRRRPRDHAAGPLHRGVAGQGAGGARHRPPVDVRLDHRTIQDRGYVWKKGTALVPSWLAFAVDRAARAALRRARRLRLHRADGGRPRRDRRRRAQDRVAWLRALLLRRRRTAEPRACTTACGAGRRPRRHRRPRRSTRSRSATAIVAAGRPLRPVRRARRRTARTARVGARGPGARRADRREGRGAARPTPSGDRELGADPDTGRAVVAKTGRYGPYVTEVLPDDAPKTAKPRTGVAVQDDVARHASRSTTRCGCCRCRAWSASTRRRRGDHRAERPLRAVPEEGHRLPLARRPRSSCSRSPSTRRWRSTPSPSSAAAAAAARRRCASSATTRSSGQPVVVKDGRFGAVRHRRRDQRDPAQGRRRRDHHHRAGRRAAGREAGQGAGAEEARSREEDDGQEDGEEDGQEDRRQEVGLKRV